MRSSPAPRAFATAWATRSIGESLCCGVDELFGFLAHVADGGGGEGGLVAAALVAAGQDVAAPFFDGLGGRLEAQLAEGGGDARVEEGTGDVGALIAVGANLVVAEHQPFRGAEPDEHRVEASSGRAAQDLRSVGAVAAEAVAVAEMGERLREPRVGHDARVFGLARGSLRRRTEEPQQPADHPGTDWACQISLAYSRMVRSEENFPMRATLR